MHDFDQLEPNVSQDLSMYDDTYDCYSDPYAAQDDFVEQYQAPPSRKSKRLPTPVVTSKIGGNRLPQIPQSTGATDFINRKRLPSIGKTSVSSTQFYGDQAPYAGYDDAYSDSNYYPSTTSASAAIATSDFSTKYSPYSPYSSYMPTTSTTTTTTTSFTYFNNQAIATTAIGSSDHSYTNSIASKLSNNLQPKSVLSSILPLTTSSSSQMHNHTGYGIGSTIQTVTTATTTQSSGLGINTITKLSGTLSSIFHSKQPTTQPKTQEQQQSSLKFQLPNFTLAKTTTNTTTSVHNNDYDNNYCDDAYYNSTLPTATTPVTSTASGIGGVDGSNTGLTIASNIYNNIQQLSQNNDYPYDEKMTTTMVDYSKDDYKYNYDDFSYSENDYIATGDITNNVQNNYNNNYDDYADDGGQMIDDINHLHQQTNDNVTNNKNFYCDSSSNSLLINQDKTGGMHHLNQEHVANNQLGQATTGSNGDYGVTMTTTSASSIGE